jgi:hypothetical protein
VKPGKPTSASIRRAARRAMMKSALMDWFHYTVEALSSQHGKMSPEFWRSVEKLFETSL